MLLFSAIVPILASAAQASGSPITVTAYPWAPFISPMGEPFHTDGATLPEAMWFAQADANHDGKLTRAEFTADAGRFFRALDVNHDNVIGQEEIDRLKADGII